MAKGFKGLEQAPETRTLEHAEWLALLLEHDVTLRGQRRLEVRVNTSESAETIAEVRRFESEYFGNGQLHIVDADTGGLIARKDAYIPMNMFLDQDAAHAEITYWKRMAEQRRDVTGSTQRR
jgi:hypothetical protein